MSEAELYTSLLVSFRLKLRSVHLIEIRKKVSIVLVINSTIIVYIGSLSFNKNLFMD